MVTVVVGENSMIVSRSAFDWTIVMPGHVQVSSKLKLSKDTSFFAGAAEAVEASERQCTYRHGTEGQERAHVVLFARWNGHRRRWFAGTLDASGPTPDSGAERQGVPDRPPIFASPPGDVGGDPDGP